MGKTRANFQTMNSEARRRKLEGNGSHKAQLDRIYRRDKGICWICGKRVKRTDASRDHIREIARCTKHEARSDDNIKLAHILCNQRRHNQETPVEYPQEAPESLTFKIGDMFKL